VLVIGLDPHRVPGPWECVVIGGGVRDLPELFERVVNLVHRHAAAAAIAFSATPEETCEAASRWLPN
jgi:hypothetical protein